MEVLAPEIQVKIGASDIVAAWNCTIEKTEVYLYKEECSYADIWLSHAYEDENHRMSRDITNNMKLGKKVDISIGYAQGKSLVFSGYLDSIELEISGEEEDMVCLRAYDVMKLLQENRQCRIYTQKSHSEVFSEVIGNYSWICNSSVDDTPKEKEERIWQQDGSDYDFIMEDLIKNCSVKREFYSSLGTIFYKKPDKNEKPVMIIDSNADYFQLKASSKYINKTIQVQGCSMDFQMYTSEKDAVSKDVDSSAKKGNQMMHIPDANTQKHADSLAAWHGEELVNQARQIRMEMPGKKDVLVGTYIEVKDLDPIWNGTYQIREAVHKFHEHGYETEILLGGC